MTRGARNDKTLYDKTVVGRARSMSRRAKRTAASLLAFGLLAGGTASGAAPAQAVAYGGFSTAATATPIKLEIFEPVIPIPTEPQGEFDLSYTRVLGGSGPATSARASAFWPGAAVGEGLKTFGEQLGLPAALTGGGYPVQANAGFPGDTPEQYQEFFPGMIGRVKAGDKRTVAKVAYTPTDVNDGDAGDSKAPPANPLDALTGLFGATPAPSTNPLGTLGLLIDFDGMTSVSSSDYDGTTAVATATSRIGELRLLAGVIKLTGVNVVTKVTSTLDGGAITSQTVDVGGMTVAGQKFAYGPDGFTAVGKVTPIPGIPTSAADLLKTLGVAIEVPKPEITKSGSTAKIIAEAARVTIDTAPLRKNLPKLPLDDLVNGLPDLQQGNILKGLLLSINTIAPKIVLRLGYSEASASTITLADLGGGGAGPAAGAGGGLAPALDDVPPTTDLGGDDTTAAPVAKGMPPLRSLPMILLIGGALLASGVAWYLRQAGLLLFGGANDCSFGLQAGIPDLRKA
ncbi:hypothetical protein J2X11_000158 [Aeromicrobium panaciterrae]|uniref:Choice-of-anchor G family protein n=1 Tax=Aeromicrobium panaciterrae TaxID=363861 RepID=A0ABU1UJF9_9ACTN|nr:choice-of-anchor P family protein [Aeromicrobium panaciterrae]MDR7085319.1 hypothetical protein [Aeromicrobium panaciterrae]